MPAFSQFVEQGGDKVFDKDACDMGLDLPSCFFMGALVARRTYTFSVQNLNEPKDPSVACGKNISPMRILTLG